MSFIDRLRDRLFGFSTPVAAPYPVQQMGDRSVNDENQASDEMNFDKSRHQRFETFPKRVMFVCSGNICRSAYGEYRFRQMCAEQHPDTQVISSGTLRINGRAATQEMIEVGAERGLNLEPHRSNGLSKLLIDSSDVIFVMSEKHRMEILRIAPEAEKKIVLLGHWLNQPKFEIDDPIRQSMDFYRRVTSEIDEALKNWLKANFE